MKSLDINIGGEKEGDFPSLDINMGKDTYRTNDITNNQIYQFISYYLVYLNLLVKGLRGRVESSIQRTDLMEVAEGNNN